MDGDEEKESLVLGDAVVPMYGSLVAPGFFGFSLASWDRTSPLFTVDYTVPLGADNGRR